VLSAWKRGAMSKKLVLFKMKIDAPLEDLKQKTQAAVSIESGATCCRSMHWELPVLRPQKENILNYSD